MKAPIWIVGSRFRSIRNGATVFGAWEEPSGISRLIQFRSSISLNVFEFHGPGARSEGTSQRSACTGKMGTDWCLLDGKDNEDNNDEIVMSYELTCVVFEGYVRISVDGFWPSDEPRRIIVDIYEAWAKDRERALLLDVRHMSDIPTVISDYDTAELLENVGLREIGPIAVLDTLDREKANKFLETTALNRGLRIQFFYASEQEAINWLLPESGPEK